MNKLAVALFLFLCITADLCANPSQRYTVFVERNAFGFVRGESQPHPGPKIPEEKFATLAVSYTPNKGVSPYKAWRLVREAVKDNFYSAHAEDACFTGLVDAQWQREMALTSLAKEKVPVHNVTVIFSCN